MSELRLGIALGSQASDWASFEATARRADQLGYHSIGTWDHLYSIMGDPHQSNWEGWLTLAAWAKVTTRARLGLLVGANTFRNPGLVARLATTLDHLSDGRATLGLGGAWHEREHLAHGIDYGRSIGERLDWLDESVAAIRALLDGEEVTSPPDGHYRFDRLVLQPRPVQDRLPIMIGGSGERKTLRTVARYADLWNAQGKADTLRRKDGVLRAHCEAVGRESSDIERTVGCKPIIRDSEPEARRVLEAQMAHNRTPMSALEGDETFWVGTPQQLADQMRACRAIGFDHFVAELYAPYDVETLERWIGEVGPMVIRP